MEVGYGSDSLCAQVLKARYFRNGNFMEASCPLRASYTWRSILHGRDLLRKRLIWRVGNGESINIMTDRWIPRDGCGIPLGRKVQSNAMRVCDLLLPHEKRWDKEKLRMLFYECDVVDILCIPLSKWDGQDFLAWNHRGWLKVW